MSFYDLASFVQEETSKTWPCPRCGLKTSGSISECVCHIYEMGDGRLIEFYKDMEESYRDKQGNHFPTYESDKTEVEEELKRRGILNEAARALPRIQQELKQKFASKGEELKPVFGKERWLEHKFWLLSDGTIIPVERAHFFVLSHGKILELLRSGAVRGIAALKRRELNVSYHGVPTSRQIAKLIDLYYKYNLEKFYGDTDFDSFSSKIKDADHLENLLKYGKEFMWEGFSWGDVAKVGVGEGVGSDVAATAGKGTVMSDIAYLPAQVGVVRAALDDLRKKRKKWKLEVLEGEKEYTVNVEDQLRITVPTEHWDSFQGMIKDALVEGGYLDLSFQEDLVRSILEKYKRVETDKKIVLDSGSEVIPVATLADESGGRAQITVDDGCYMLNLLQEDDTYKYTAWVFPEAHEVLKDLGNPTEEHIARLRVESPEQFPVEESVLQERKEELIQLITEKFQKPPISVALAILEKWNTLFGTQKELTNESVVSLCNEKVASTLLESLLKDKAEDLGQIDILIQDLSEKQLCQVLSDTRLGCRLQGNYKGIKVILECQCSPKLVFSLVVEDEKVVNKLSESKPSLLRIDNVFYPRVGQLVIENGVLETLKQVIDVGTS